MEYTVIRNHLNKRMNATETSEVIHMLSFTGNENEHTKFMHPNLIQGDHNSLQHKRIEETKETFFFRLF